MSSAAATATTRPDTFGPTGLRVTGPLTFDEWETLGHTLGGIAKATPWLIGDYVVLGEALFGERGTPPDMGVKVETVLRYGNVARQIPPADRRASLSWYAHSQVAYLPRKERNAWLEKAERNDWDSPRLRAELAAADALPARPKATADTPSTITPREVLTMLKQDETWATLAKAALSTLDTPEDVDLARCPSCGHQWAL